MRKYTFEEYMRLPHEERRVLRRAAFGDTYLVEFCAGVDLLHLRAVLEAENERTGTFPTKWTDEPDLDGLEDLT